MISAECFPNFTVVDQSSTLYSLPWWLKDWKCWLDTGLCSESKMKFFTSLQIPHFLLLFSFLILILMFAIFLPVRIPGYRRERGGWFAGAERSPDLSCFPPGPSLVKRVVGQKLTRKIVSNCDLQWPWSETVRYRGSHQQLLSVSTGSIQTRTQYTGKNSQITYQSL